MNQALEVLAQPHNSSYDPTWAQQLVGSLNRSLRRISGSLDSSSSSSSFLIGFGAPAATLGNVGDTYFDRTTKNLYGPRQANGWGSPASLQGPPGSTGPTGATGAGQGPPGAPGAAGTPGKDGTTVIVGPDDPPLSIVGKDGDLYLSSNSGAFYGPKKFNAWPSVSTAKTGVIQGTHADRTSSALQNLPAGALYLETDRGVFYISRVVSNAMAWVYSGGISRGAFSARPSDLASNDAGFLFYSEDTIELFEWSGSAWSTMFGDSITSGDLGDLTEASSSVLTISGGTNAVVGSGVSVEVKQAGASQDGYLSQADWNTFNSKQAALTLPLAIANGGTGQATAPAALSALGGVSLSGSNTLTNGAQFISSATGNSLLTINTASTTAFGGMFLQADSTAFLSGRMYGSAATTVLAGITLANWGVLYSNFSNGLLIETVTSVPIVFGTNNVERARFVGAGNLLIGTTTDNGNKFQVNGSSSFAGAMTISSGFTQSRPTNFASNGVNWGLSITNASAADTLLLGQSGATYSTGGAIAWIGNSNAFLYFGSTQDLRIGSGLGSNPALVIKATTRNVLVGTATDNATDLLQVNGSVLATGLHIPTGTNKKVGTGTLVAGTVTIANTSITANSKIFLQATSTGANSGVLAVTAKSAGVSFTVASSNAADTATFDYFIVETA